MKARGGLTLVEVMLAGAIIAISVLALFEGIMVATRIARENADYLTAEAIVWDAVWREFNKDFKKIAIDSSPRVLDLNAAEAGSLAAYDARPKLLLYVSAVDGHADLKRIQGNVVWGPSGDRRQLSDWDLGDLESGEPEPVKNYDLDVFVYRGRLGRVSTW